MSRTLEFYDSFVRQATACLEAVSSIRYQSVNRLDPAKDLRLFHRMTIEDGPLGLLQVSIATHFCGNEDHPHMRPEQFSKLSLRSEDLQWVNMDEMQAGREYWFTKNRVLDLKIPPNGESLRLYDIYSEDLVSDYVPLRADERLLIGEPLFVTVFLARPFDRIDGDQSPTPPSSSFQ